MKNLFTILGLAGVLAVALMVTNVSAHPIQGWMGGAPAITPVPQGQGSTAQTGWGIGAGMGGGRMSGHMMGRRGSTNSSAQAHPGAGMHPGPMNMETGGDGMGYDEMMLGVAPMADDVARSLGMTTNDLYSQMAAGKSMAQVASGLGITEQQLEDAILNGRQAAYNQAVKGGYMTQAQMDAMLQHMHDNVDRIMHDQGYGSTGWGMMWGTQATPAAAP